MRKSFLLAAASAVVLAASSAGAFAQTAPTTVVAPMPAYYVGHNIVNSQGQVVGKVIEIRGNDLYVLADPTLNVGQRTYIWPRDRLMFAGTGQTVMITTPLTREQIVALPVYTMTPAEVKHQGAPPPNGLAGGMIPVQPYAGPLPRSVIGKNIYNGRNDVVGFVTDVRDDKMLVSVGQFLGHGERVVVFPREWVQFNGAGDAVSLTTAADIAQISSLPIYAGIANEAPTRTR